MAGTCLLAAKPIPELAVVSPSASRRRVARRYFNGLLSVAGGSGKTPLFRSINRKGQLTERRVDRREVLAMVKRRVRKTGLPPSICCHSFRATGITTYLREGGSLEHAQRISNHSSVSTTKLYDRRDDEINADEIKRIEI